MLHLHLQEQIGRQEVNLTPVLEHISITQETDFIYFEGEIWVQFVCVPSSRLHQSFRDFQPPGNWLKIRSSNFRVNLVTSKKKVHHIITGLLLWVKVEMSRFQKVLNFRQVVLRVVCECLIFVKIERAF